MNVKQTLILSLTVVLVCFESRADLLDQANGSLTASTTIDPGYLDPSFPIAQISDGIDLDNDGSISGPFNGFVANTTSGLISFTFSGPYTITDFLLANDINLGGQGVEDFTLSFYNSSASLISTTGTLTANAGNPADATHQTFSLGSLSDVARVDMNILSVYNNEGIDRIEIRETAFDGFAQPTPEPGSFALAGMGALSFWFFSRQKKQSSVAGS